VASSAADVGARWRHAGADQGISAGGVALCRDKKSEGERLFAQGLAVGKMESQRPAAVAQALHDSGMALNEQEQKQTAESYLLAALAMREKQSPESLPVVETLSELADVVDDIAVDENDRKYYLLTRDYASRANEMAKRVAPESPARVKSLWHLCTLYIAFDTYPEVPEYCLEALRIQKDIAPGGSMRQASILRTFGAVEEMGGHLVQAHEYLAEAVDMGERLAPESARHRDSLSHCGRYRSRHQCRIAFQKGAPALQNVGLSGFPSGMGTGWGGPGVDDLLLDSEAQTEAWYGHLKGASELTRRAMDSARRNDAKETAALYQVTSALSEVEAGNREQARSDATAAVRLAPNRDVRATAALVLARAGNAAAAEKLANELDKTFPLDTLVQKYWLPTVRAAVALQRKDPNHAVELLKVASPIELSVYSNIAIALCPVYLRGEAYLMLHDGNAAEGEFQKFIDHRGLVANAPWGALARLGRARALAQTGDTERSLDQYREFLNLWKNADPDLRLLKEARAEYKKLSAKSADERVMAEAVRSRNVSKD